MKTLALALVLVTAIPRRIDGPNLIGYRRQICRPAHPAAGMLLG
jgi:hypothetical protein